MRWLLLKDLRILRRSPLLVGLLVVYAVGVGLAVAVALKDTPDKPRVAFVNEVPEGEGEFSVGGQTFDATSYAGRLFTAVEPVRVTTREEALRMVRDGEVLGALIVPEDVVDRLQATVNLAGAGQRPTLEVLYNAEDPLKTQEVQSRIESQLAQANKAIADQLAKLAGRYLDILLRGGDFRLLGRSFQVLGLQNTERILRAVSSQLPAGDRRQAALDRVATFARLAVQNLDVAGPVLQTVGSPLAVKQTIVEGADTPLEDFFVAIAITVSLMFVAVLLGAGMLALEREEHAFARLVRGLTTRTTLLAEKVVLAALCSGLATLLLTVVVAAVYDLDWGRAPLWVAVIAAGGLAFGTLGVAIGALARDVRAASLLAFLLALPIAFLALIPSGAVSASLFDVVSVVNALFPFDPALDAANAALTGADPGVPGPLAHLAALVAGHGVLARVALRRFS
ncbi:ABC transporter permease [Conexibacter sp. SYSU D00693]|uniref:ABC transporter permease n=1 Tax=Conexibacter sp. SYSU D00693 TaxID=2812560 RepID=UPI00196AE311|nr:ABC transporter permease [Conexibacter sp. SYSU D00693]